MTDSKRLYFIPILAHAIKRKDDRQTMSAAFDEIEEKGNQLAYKEGFRQFQEFVGSTIIPSGMESDEKIQLLRDALYRIIYDLVTDTFEGSKKQEDTLIKAIKNNPHWNAEFERIKREAQAFVAPDAPLSVELYRGDRLIGSLTPSTDSSSISSILPGRYTVRLSNGRTLWEGDLTRENLIWAYAHPEQDFPMAAETEKKQQEPTRTISLLEGELILQVFTGLESGRITMKSEKGTWK